MAIRYSLTFLLAVAAIPVLAADPLPYTFDTKSIKQYPLDERTVYQVKISREQVTTLTFPGPITALEAANVTVDPQHPAAVLLHYQAGRQFFSLRALMEKAKATINVIWNRKTYVLQLESDREPLASVTFFVPPNRADGSNHPAVGPSRLLNLIDRAKAYPVLRQQHPELVPQVEFAAPHNKCLYQDFSVEVAEVYRFDEDDTIILRLVLENTSKRDLLYQSQTLAVQLGGQVYPASMADASGLVPAASEGPPSVPGTSLVYVAITGSPGGGRNNLSVNNTFNVLVSRSVPPTSPLQP